MPIFEFACGNCGHQFETLVRSGTTPQCPQCQSVTLEKQLSVFATSASGAHSSAPEPSFTPCAGCGHPDGPGACAMH